MQGWVSFHRKIEEWEWYDDANTFRLFFHLVLKANHKDNKWRGIDIKRGQLITSNKQLAKQLKLTDSKIRTSLNKLKSTGEISYKTTNKNTLITIANYDLYQSDEGRIADKITIKSQSNNNQIATNNNEDNEKNENKQYKDNDFKSVFDYYISLDLIGHKRYSQDMTKAMKLAKKELKINEEEMKRMLKRHEEKVKATVKSEYPVKKRKLAEFFGQKKHKSVSLICSDYIDECYEHVEVVKKITPKIVRKERVYD